MKPDPDFQRLYRTLKRQEPDRVPLAELHVDVPVKEAFLGRPIRTLADEIDFWYRAGYDYVCLSYGLRVGEVISTGQLHKSQVPTAYGHPREVEWADENVGVITSKADFEAYPWNELMKWDFSALEQAPRYLPPGMKVIVYSGKIYSRVWMMMGFTHFCLSLADNPDLVARMFQISGEIAWDAFTKIIEYDCVGGIWISDDLAYAEELMIHPRWYRQYLFPWYKRMGQVCKERDLLFIFHSDGNLTRVLDDIIDCGFDALHPIEPKAMDIGWLKREVGDRLSLIGNIDLSYTLTRGTPSEVEAEVRERIRACAPGGGYAIGSANSVTYYVPLENYNAMREAAFCYGTYPITR